MKENHCMVINRDYLTQEMIEKLESDYGGAITTNYTNREIINIILDYFEHFIFKHLAEATPEQPVQVKICNGISLISWIEKHKSVILNGNTVSVPDRLHVRGKITRYLMRKLNLDSDYIKSL